MTAVIIPVYNGAEMVPITAPAVLSLRGVDEIVWVDDGSTDDTPVILTELGEQDPRVRLVRLPENQGRSAARNAGVAACSADILVFFDGDIEPGPDAAVALADALNGLDAVASVGRFEPVPTDPDEPYQDYAVHFQRGPAPGARAADAIDWRFFLTGACALRRQDLNAVGGFREDIAYGEDVALGRSLQQRSPEGLRLAETTVRLHDIGDLDRALRHATAYGQALPRLKGGGASPMVSLDRLLPIATASRPVASLLRRGLSLLPAGPIRRRCVRYLLGLTVLHAYRRARDHAFSSV